MDGGKREGAPVAPEKFADSVASEAAAHTDMPVAPAAPSSAPAASTPTIALVLGICSIVFSALTPIGMALGVAAIVVGGRYLKQTGTAGGKARGGKVCGIVGIVLSVLLLVLAVAGASFVLSIGGLAAYQDHLSDPPAAVQPAGTEDGPGEASDEDPGEDAGDDVIHAGTVDTSSMYTFEVKTAVVGIDEYTQIPVVILMCVFENGSDGNVSFSDALGVEASQGGHSLSEAYLEGAANFNYESISPGEGIPVFVAWELRDADAPVDIVVRDQYHYAKEEVFSESYTLDELVANAKAFAEELKGIIDEDGELLPA